MGFGTTGITREATIMIHGRVLINFLKVLKTLLMRRAVTVLKIACPTLATEPSCIQFHLTLLSRAGAMDKGHRNLFISSDVAKGEKGLGEGRAMKVLPAFGTQE